MNTPFLHFLSFLFISFNEISQLLSLADHHDYSHQPSEPRTPPLSSVPVDACSICAAQQVSACPNQALPPRPERSYPT